MIDPPHSTRKPAAAPPLAGRFPPELELLLAATAAQGGSRRWLRTVAAGALDWNVVAVQALGHGVATRLFRRLESAAVERVPARIRGRLEQHLFSVVAQNLPRVEQLQHLLGDLEEAGVAAAPLKGPALAATLGGDPLEREFVDLDLLVRRAELGRAAGLLQARGYLAIDPARRQRDLGRRPLDKHYLFRHPDPSWAPVELHAEAVEPYWAIRLDTEQLLRNAGTVVLGGVAVPQLAAADLLLVLALHGTSHGWRHLMWLGDLARLLPALSDSETEEALERATAIGCRRILLFSCRLANDLLGGAPVAGLRAAWRTDPAVRGLVARTASRLARPLQAAGPLRLPIRERLLVRERGGDTFRLALAHARKTLFHLGRRILQTAAP